MRFFFRKKDEAKPWPLSAPIRIQLSNRNFELLKDCDVALKFWLPEYVEKMIDRMCSFQDTSASDLIRQILFIHLYGRYDLFGLIERQDQTYNLQTRERTRFSLRELSLEEEVERSLEAKNARNIADVKVWVPAKMKDDIKLLAHKAGKKPSQFVREIIITHLFGHVPPDGISAAENPPDGFNEEAFSEP
ncbi:MAG: hypothetical protein PHN92_07885 [Geobacter sp.]|nr:hypothetical protein [Geobacter sp.]